MGVENESNKNERGITIMAIVNEETIKIEVAKELQAELIALAKLPADKMPEAMVAYNNKVVETIKTRMKAAADSVAKTAQDQIKMKDVFKAFAMDVLKPAWNKIEGFEKITSVRMFTFQVTKSTDENGIESIGEPTIILSTPKVVKAKGEGNTGSKGNPLTVNGKEYPSAAAAKAELVPDKASAQMSRPAIVSMLQGAGHTVVA